MKYVKKVWHILEYTFDGIVTLIGFALAEGPQIFSKQAVKGEQLKARGKRKKGDT